MKITFVIPAYNVEETIGRTIDSILWQTDDRYQIIIVNDGSTDRTEEICLKYLEENRVKILYVYQENKGLGGARNHGMELTETEYVSFLDSDDWLMPEYVANIMKQVEGTAPEERPEIIMTLPKIYYETSGLISDWYDKLLFGKIFDRDGTVVTPDEYSELYRFEVNQCRKVLSMEFVRRIDFRFREQIKWEDVVPHFYLLSKCKKCMGIGSAGFYYRLGSRNQITAMRGKERLDILTVFDDLLNYAAGENRKDLMFPVMRVMVRFAIWSIRMADTDTRKELVGELHTFFRRVPKAYFIALRKSAGQEYSRADARQYRLFMFAIKYRVFCWIFYDYLFQDMAEKIIKRLLGAEERVA